MAGHKRLKIGGIYMKPGRYSWCLVSGWNDLFCLINTWDRYENFSSRSSNRDEVRPVCFHCQAVSCKRIKKNVWRPTRTHAGLSSSLGPFPCVTLNSLCLSFFFLPWTHVKTSAFQNKRLKVHKWLFGPEKVLGLSRNGSLVWCT